ncbi:MAG: hypothetical protein ACKV1O_23540 [Saprospiraceae bacterium]
MYVKLFPLLFVIALCNQILHSQPTLSSLARDTIVAKSEFLSTTYLLNGKKLTLPVMQWFMSDYPEANDQIRISALSSQVSLTGLSVGGLFGLSGLFLYQQNERIGGDMLKIGAGGITLGVAFQLLASVYKKRAAKSYNRAVKKSFHAQGATNFKLELQPDGSGIRFAFVF